MSRDGHQLLMCDVIDPAPGSYIVVWAYRVYRVVAWQSVDELSNNIIFKIT